jgi:hypothetical protein
MKDTTLCIVFAKTIKTNKNLTRVEHNGKSIKNLVINNIKLLRL